MYNNHGGEGDTAIAEYRKRRAKRLGVEKRCDAIEEYRKRRAKRVRMDAGVGWAYGLAKSKGIDTEGMTPEEVFKALAETGEDVSTKGKKKAKENAKEAKAKTAAPIVKGVTYAKSESGFKIPTFDAGTFDENVEEKKKIARDASKKLIPQVKKALSTEIKEIKRPAVDDSTRGYLKKAIAEATPEQIEKGLEAASKIYGYWEKHEPAITNAVVGVVKDVGGSMYGLDFRRKFDASIAKKAVADALDPDLDYNGDIERAAQDIKDGTRYTAVFETENFTDGYNKVKETLEKMGIREYRCKNFFTQYRSQNGNNGKIGEQKSIQSVFETPDGQKFELQFHTPESMAAKEINHPTYKQKKEPYNKNVEYNKKRSLFMRDTSSTVPDPKGVFDIEEHKLGENGYKRNEEANV